MSKANMIVLTAEDAATPKTCITIEAGLDTLKGKALAEQNTLKDEELLNELSNLSPYDFDYATLNLTSQYKRIVQGNMLYVLWAHYTKKGAYIFSCPKATSFKVSVDPFAVSFAVKWTMGKGVMTLTATMLTPEGDLPETGTKIIRTGITSMQGLVDKADQTCKMIGKQY